MSCAFSLPLLKAPQKSMAVGAAGGAERTNASNTLSTMLRAVCPKCAALTAYGMSISSCRNSEKAYSLRASCRNSEVADSLLYHEHTAVPCCMAWA